MIYSIQVLGPTAMAIMVLADTMAAAATEHNAHGYDMLMHAREDLMQGLIDFVTDEQRMRAQPENTPASSTP